jgi:competence protein ComEA
LALVDGQQLRIPTKAEMAAWSGGAGAKAAGGQSAVAGGGTAAGPAGAVHPGALLDLNSAGTDALQRLPGIGPVLAERIVSHRQAHGRYATVDDLLAVSGIGPHKLADLRHLVTVR